MATMLPSCIYSDADVAIQAAIEKFWQNGIPIKYFQSPRETQHRNIVESSWRLVKRKLEVLRHDPNLTREWPILLMVAINSINQIPLKSCVSRLQLHHGSNFAKSMLKFSFEEEDLFSQEETNSRREEILAKTSMLKTNTLVQEGDYYFVKYHQNVTLGPFQALNVHLLRKQVEGVKVGTQHKYTHSFKNVLKPTLSEIKIPLGYSWDKEFKQKLDCSVRPKKLPK